MNRKIKRFTTLLITFTIITFFNSTYSQQSQNSDFPLETLYLEKDSSQINTLRVALISEDKQNFGILKITRGNTVYYVEDPLEIPYYPGYLLVNTKELKPGLYTIEIHYNNKIITKEIDI